MKTVAVAAVALTAGSFVLPGSVRAAGDPAAGKTAFETPTPLVAAVTVTSGGMLFTGDMNNDFLAIDAATGKTLYRFNTGGSIGGGVISYAVGGKQYVATTSGVVSGFFGGRGTSALVIFALPDSAQTARTAGTVRSAATERPAAMGRTAATARAAAPVRTAAR